MSINQKDDKLRIPGYILQKRNEIEKKMVQSGEMDRLQEYLRKKLIASGWKENLKSYCKQLIREKGIQRITVESMMHDLEQRGKHTIPLTIREDMLSRVRKYIDDTLKQI